MDNLPMSWVNEVVEIFRYYKERPTGRHIGVEESWIMWCYRSGDLSGE